MESCNSALLGVVSGFKNQSVMWTQPDVAGWLDKRGGSFTSWKKRFFILQSSSLFYFTSNNNIQGATPLGVVPLEGSSLEVADQQAGGMHRKWCIMVKLGPQFMAKRDTYVLSAPSKQALEEWLDKLTTAGSTHAKLLAQLNKSRRMGCNLRAKLLQSPTNAKMLADARGEEAEAIQRELTRVKGQLGTIHAEALEASALAQDQEGAAMRNLARWCILSQRRSVNDVKSGNEELGVVKWGDTKCLHLAFCACGHIAGHNIKDASKLIDRLKGELDLTVELCQLLENKAGFLQGCGIENLDEDGRTGLNLMCEKALNSVLEQQAKIRVKAPRYTTEVDPLIFPENDTQFIHTSETYDLSLKARISAKKRIVDLKLKAAKATEVPIISRGVISRLGAAKDMAFKAGMAAVAGIQTQLESSGFIASNPGPSTDVGFPDGGPRAVAESAGEEDMSEEYSDGEFSDSYSEDTYDQQQQQPEGSYPRELNVVSRNSQMLSAVPGYLDEGQVYPSTTAHQASQGPGLQTPQSAMFSQPQQGQLPNYDQGYRVGYAPGPPQFQVVPRDPMFQASPQSPGPPPLRPTQPSSLPRPPLSPPYSPPPPPPPRLSQQYRDHGYSAPPQQYMSQPSQGPGQGMSHSSPFLSSQQHQPPRAPGTRIAQPTNNSPMQTNPLFRPPGMQTLTASQGMSIQENQSSLPRRAQEAQPMYNNPPSQLNQPFRAPGPPALDQNQRWEGQGPQTQATPYSSLKGNQHLRAPGPQIQHPVPQSPRFDQAFQSQPQRALPPAGQSFENNGFQNGKPPWGQGFMPQGPPPSQNPSRNPPALPGLFQNQSSRSPQQRPFTYPPPHMFAPRAPIQQPGLHPLASNHPFPMRQRERYPGHPVVNQRTGPGPPYQGPPRSQVSGTLSMGTNTCPPGAPSPQFQSQQYPRNPMVNQRTVPGPHRSQVPRAPPMGTNTFPSGAPAPQLRSQQYLRNPMVNQRAITGPQYQGGPPRLQVPGPPPMGTNTFPPGEPPAPQLQLQQYPRNPQMPQLQNNRGMPPAFYTGQTSHPASLQPPIPNHNFMLQASNAPFQDSPVQNQQTLGPPDHFSNPTPAYNPPYSPP